jgi:hypothetical protein
MAKVNPSKVVAKSLKQDLQAFGKVAQRAAKKRPRGRPFEKGHKFGFPKGVSGNPGGKLKNPRPVYVTFKDKLTEELLKPATAAMRARAGLRWKRGMTKYDCLIAGMVENAVADPSVVFSMRNVIEGLLPTKNYNLSVSMQQLMDNPEFSAWLEEQHGQFLQFRNNGGTSEARRFRTIVQQLPAGQDSQGE